MRELGRTITDRRGAAGAEFLHVGEGLGELRTALRRTI
jgi:hypothetical protein